jgi:hypothetical protein
MFTAVANTQIHFLWFVSRFKVHFFPVSRSSQFSLALIYATYSAHLVILHFIILRKFCCGTNFEVPHSAILPVWGFFMHVCVRMCHLPCILATGYVHRVVLPALACGQVFLQVAGAVTMSFLAGTSVNRNSRSSILLHIYNVIRGLGIVD